MGGDIPGTIEVSQDKELLKPVELLTGNALDITGHLIHVHVMKAVTEVLLLNIMERKTRRQYFERYRNMCSVMNIDDHGKL